MKNNTLEQIAIHSKDTLKSEHQNDHYSLRNIIRDRMDYQLGYVKAAQVQHYFSKAFDKKHKEQKNTLPNNEYEGLKTYTLARYVSRYYNIK